MFSKDVGVPVTLVSSGYVLLSLLDRSQRMIVDTFI